MDRSRSKAYIVQSKFNAVLKTVRRLLRDPFSHRLNLLQDQVATIPKPGQPSSLFTTTTTNSIMSLGKFVLHQVDIVGDEPGFLLKQCTVRDLPHHLPGEYLRDDCTLYASVCDVVDDSMAQALGVRDGDLICDEEDGICQLSDLRTARNLVSQSRYTLLLLREQTKRDGVKVKAPRLDTRQKGTFSDCMVRSVFVR